jgi:oligoendopeptidase F
MFWGRKTVLSLILTAVSIMGSDAAGIVAEAEAFVNKFNTDYEAKHLAFENQFWGTKMALSGDFSAEKLSKTKTEMEDLLSDYSIVEKAEQYRSSLPDVASEDLKKCLDIIIRTCKCYSTSPENKKIREETSKKESELEMARNRLKLGFTLKDTFTAMSSVGLRNTLRTAPDEETRKAAYEGLRSIGPFVCENGFVDIIKLRNKLAKSLGFADYYDYKVTNAEAMSKVKLFEILDGLEQGTRPIMESARKELENRFGKEALEPWNQSFKMAGSVVKKMDPYFPFAKAPEQYIKSYAKLKIEYEGATMNLDLLDRQNKYSNGFCHWPKVAWKKPDGSWQPSETNFTSLGDPSAVGSGKTALTTLMHEAGHAAHFANIKQPSPLFGQERAPFSAALAEGQSMFLDSLVEDAAWRAKYALDVSGNPLPFEIIEEEIKAIHPFKVFGLRAMLAVPYFEKALYELPDEEVTAERIQSLADEIETKIQGGFSPRPLLSVPHIISDEASCYYHAYVVSESISDNCLWIWLELVTTIYEAHYFYSHR